MKTFPAVLFCLCFPLTWVQAQIMEDDKENTPPPRVGTERIAMELLAKFHDPASVLWLSANGEEFLALLKPALRSRARGGVLLLHAQGQHPDWPGPLSYLRTQLPKWGWNTLSIALPDPEPIAQRKPDTNRPRAAEVLDESEEVFDPTTDSVSDGSVIPEQERPKAGEAKSEAIAVERIVAAVEQLKNLTGTNIVLYGQGLGALRASRYWQETGDNSIQAIIFVDGQNGMSNSDFQLTKALNNPGMPVLDIIHSRSLQAELDAKQRSEQAAILGLKAYQQHWFAENNERLANTVNGFLRRQVSP